LATFARASETTKYAVASTPPLSVGRLDDAGPGGENFVELGANLGVQLHIFGGEPDRCGHRRGEHE
jgi:hypothetical protein